MSIIKEMDAAISDEMAKMATTPRESQFLIVLNTEGQNEYLRETLTMHLPIDGKLMIERRWRGAIIAVSHDDEMPRVSVFTKAKRDMA